MWHQAPWSYLPDREIPGLNRSHLHRNEIGQWEWHKSLADDLANTDTEIATHASGVIWQKYNGPFNE